MKLVYRKQKITISTLSRRNKGITKTIAREELGLPFTILSRIYEKRDGIIYDRGLKRN
ncbi:MAG TPA: hypothetical protein VFP49_13580 [Nitrososphaeraceae archaeon]|nr:hypothetical protein [Nitrososphaeraceae archaeon]